MTSALSLSRQRYIVSVRAKPFLFCDLLFRGYCIFLSEVGGGGGEGGGGGGRGVFSCSKFFTRKTVYMNSI